jgi:hypothetical protein
MGAELFHAGRRTDVKNDEANSSFPQFCERTWKKATFLCRETKDNSTVVQPTALSV